MPKSSQRLQNYKKGLWAENIAALYLRLHGYRILNMRYKTSVGEIDILARRGKTLIAVEVKARDTYERAVQAVTPSTRNRIQNALMYYVSHNTKYANSDFRFDVITIKMPFFIRHIDNAWQARA